MTLDAETTRLALTILSVVVLPLASMAYTWIATRDKDNTAYIKAVEKTLGDEIVRHRSRLEQLEVNLSHLPRADDISGMKATISRMQAMQESQLRDIHATRTAVTRIEDFLLKQAVH